MLKFVSRTAALSVSAFALAAALFFAPVAKAATIDINAGAVLSSQESVGDVNQLSIAADLAIGEVEKHSSVSSTAANLNNSLSASVDVQNLQATTYGGELGLVAFEQTSIGDVNQAAGALTGSGSVENYSTSAATAINANNLASVTVNVH